MKEKHRLLCVVAAAALSLTFRAAAGATSEWRPDKRIEIVVPSAPGGGNDRIARIVQKTIQDRRMSDAAITIVNKPGAGQVVGIAYLNQQPADGQHIGMASVSFMTNYITGRSPIGPNDLVPPRAAVRGVRGLRGESRLEHQDWQGPARPAQGRCRVG